MCREELWQRFPIILKPHNATYSTWYQEEATQLLHMLQQYTIFRMSHIGSTAVDGLIAKPIVDILLEISTPFDLNAVSEALQNNHWLVMSQDRLSQTIDLNKGYTMNGFAQKVYHLHIKPPGDWGELYFRDYLQQHPDVARQYEALKQRLQTEYQYNRDAYTDAKSDFIQAYTKKAKEYYPQKYLPR